MDIRHIRPKMTVFEDFRQDLHKRAITPILILLPGLIAVGFCLRGAVTRRLLGDSRLRSARKDAFRGLAKAKSQMTPDAPKEFYSQVAKSLIDYIGARFDVPTPGISALTVGALIGESADRERAGLLASECIEVCDFYRFSAQKSSTEEMQNVLSRVCEALSMLHRMAPNKEGELRSQ